MTTVCVDASLVIKLVAQEPGSDLADRLFATWKAGGVRMVAPPFYAAEVDSVLRQKVALRRELTEEEAYCCFSAACLVPIEPLNLPGQRQRAWDLASMFGFPHVYDAVYLALTELLGCEFWTADRRLVEKVGGRLPFVHLLDEIEPQLGGGIS